ncbi:MULTISPECIES: lactonase family protein [Actinosynnema]|uniref:lactonase family protein n=1 Tax=Actinosynnema TaxID=40566 RepID=UPI0020A43A5D|nr:lactonase family protein [Actinosynnema pretiosum]MCP2095523.1 6-phosphogluconolactonase, cycloisomerase 2 family [Actinosynnema pretiosum]
MTETGTGSAAVFLGTYTTWEGGGEGIGLAAYDRAKGVLTHTGVVADVPNPSFLVRAGDRLYAVNEQEDGAVTALAIGADGVPVVLNRRSTGGADPCHLVLHEGHLLAANYTSGSVSAHPVLPDGSLGERTDLVRHEGSGPNRDRQEGPHAHQVVVDPTGRFVLAVDLGADSVLTYRLVGGRLEHVATARTHAGAGPRHLAFHPGGRFAYVANELDSTVTVASYADGVLTPGAVLSTLREELPEGGENYPAEILVSPDGRHVYVSNRGHDSIAVFQVLDDGAGLELSALVPAWGAYPRHLAFDPTGALLFASNQNSNTVATFELDGAGLPVPTGTWPTPVPVCVTF